MFRAFCQNEYFAALIERSLYLSRDRRGAIGVDGQLPEYFLNSRDGGRIEPCL